MHSRAGVAAQFKSGAAASAVVNLSIMKSGSPVIQFPLKSITIMQTEKGTPTGGANAAARPQGRGG
jgi:hypothetical protein